MSYKGKVGELLGSAGAEEGDLVRVVVEDRTYEGTVMPHHDFSHRDILTLKLGNGYNIGIDVSTGAALTLLEKGDMPGGRGGVDIEARDTPPVSFLSTGGTIASFVDYRTGAVHPALTSEELVFANPELVEHCDPRARVLFSELSENLTPEHWYDLALEVAKELNSGSTGVVVPHGTDTMGYTAAVLSFMLRDLSGPVVLVGSQRSSDRPSSDAHLNLLGAVAAAGSDLGEVVVAMHEGPSDEGLVLHRGTRVRKMHSSRRDAFRSMGIEPVGHIVDGRVSLSSDHRPREGGPVRVEGKLEPDVALVHFHPGMKPGHILSMLQHEKGLVIAGTGLGHVSDEIIDILREMGREKPVVMTTQCLEGTVDMDVYSSGRELIKAGVIDGRDMLPETALVKLMWVLGRTDDHQEIGRLMTRNIVGEICERRTL